MAVKMITRTIKVYTYTTGVYNVKTQKCDEIENHIFTHKLSSREERKEFPGKLILNVSTGEALYGMSLDDFLLHAKPITKEEGETEIDVVG